MSEPSPIQVPEKGIKVSWTLGFIGCFAALICAGAAIIMPILSSAGESIGTNTCMDNLRRLSAASFLYAEENSGSLPAEDWPTLIEPHEPDEITYACPTQRRIDPRSSGYALSKPVAGAKLDAIDAQRTTPLFFDSKASVLGAIAEPTEVPSPGRHRNRRANNVAYVDGHVDTVPAR